MAIGHHQTTEISTRSLVESMLRDDATIDAGALYDVANLLGMTDQQVRLCIKRMVSDGQFVVEGRGRKAVLYATDLLRSTITPDLEYVRFMYAQDRGGAPWDGQWHLVAFAVPESSRAARDAIRDAIVRLGGAPIQGGLYVSPNQWEDKIASVATELAITEHISTLTTTDLSVGGTGQPRELASRLWPLEEVAERHRRLLTFAESALSALQRASAIERLTIAIELAAEFTRAVDPDPLLPPRLLPQPWIGTAARATVAACWAELIKVDAPQRIQLFQWYADVIAEVAWPASVRS
ncbi:MULTISPECIES: PaaX family transcriptional regulator C-terminal domain-containing protein [unclassified Mycolicibacterium]|uniref:PaaX family transcriptional regulator C-terminal domain-containing protein n=1 Tax=unclassified Mycolicibacterium TaxID=2636767 RepID=UPI0035CB04F0